MDESSVGRIRLALKVLCAHYDSTEKITQADIDKLKACLDVERQSLSLEVIARIVVQRELDRERARTQSSRNLHAVTRAASQ